MNKSDTLLYSKAQARDTGGGLVRLKAGRPIMRVRRVDEINRRMRQWIAQHVFDPNRDYMQTDSVPKPKYVKLLTGETVEYKGP